MEKDKEDDSKKKINKFYQTKQITKNDTGLIMLGFILVAFAIILSFNRVNVSVIDPQSFKEIQPINVNTIEILKNPVSLFLTHSLVNTTLLNDESMDSITVNVVNTTGCIPFDAINIIDKKNYFQALITSITANTITMDMPLDVDFNAVDTKVQCAEWDLSKTDGSITPVEFSIQPPKNATWHLTSTVITILDNKEMDSSLFGGIPSLTNGIIGRFTNEHKKNLFIIYNNNGFVLRGFDLKYIEKSPAGVFGLNANLNGMDTFGTVINLHGGTYERWGSINQDDLTGLTEVAITVNGHNVNN